MDFLSELVDVWLQRIRDAEEQKDRVFGATARKLWMFLTRSYRDVYLHLEDGTEGISTVSDGEPFYKPRLNKCREFVSLYLPYVAARVPVRSVNLRKPPLIDALLSDVAKLRWAEREAAAKILEWWLNYCAEETDHEQSMRMVVQEALVKGRGVMWTEVYEGPNRVLVGSSADTVDNFLVDPAARTMMDAGWIVRRRQVPAYEAQRLLAVTDEELKRMEAARSDKDRDTALPPGTVEYYEIFSRIGVGHHLAEQGEVANLKEALESLGRYCWLAVAKGVDYPLNLRRDSGFNSVEEIAAAVRWPIETWGDIADPWPVTVLDFMPNVDNPWATSPLEPGLPMQVFLDHLYAYVMGRARIATRTIIMASRAISEELAERLNAGSDVEVVAVDPAVIAEMQRMLVPLELPDIKPDIWQLIQLVERAFDKAVGLDALLYGAAPRPTPRSATEIDVRREFLQTRPNEYADAVEKWATRVAAKEGVATRLYIDSSTVQPLLGEDSASALESQALKLWAQYCETDDPVIAASEYEFSVVEGSSRRKNKQVLATTAQSIIQMFGAQAFQMAVQSGNVAPFNKVIGLLSEAIDTDLSAFMLQPPEQPPQQMAQQPHEGPA